MVTTIMMSPTWGNHMNAVGALFESFWNWLSNDDAGEAETTSSTYSNAQRPTFDPGHGAPMSIAARNNPRFGATPPEAIETRVDESWRRYLSVETKAKTDAGEAPKDNPEVATPKCRMHTIPFESIEYRYNAEAMRRMRLPLCGR